MKNFRAADKTHAGGDEKHDINYHWPNGHHGYWLQNIVKLSYDVNHQPFK